MSDLVTFRKFTDGDVIALFPDLPTGQETDGNQFIMSYMHIGQHGDAHSSFIADLTPATADEYSDLKAELTSIGYELEVQSCFYSSMVSLIKKAVTAERLFSLEVSLERIYNQGWTLTANDFRKLDDILMSRHIALELGEVA